MPSFLLDYLSSHLLPNASLRTQGRRQLSSFYFSLTHHINKGVMHLVQPQTPGSQTLRGADHQHLTQTVIYTQDAPMWSENYSPGYKLPNSSKQKNGSGSYLLHSSFLKSNQNNQFSVNLRLWYIDGHLFPFFPDFWIHITFGHCSSYMQIKY